MYTFDHTIDFNGKEITATVEIESYIPGDPGCRTMPDGDPGWPSEPSEVEFRVYTVREEDITSLISPETYSEIEEKALGYAEKEAENALADAMIDMKNNGLY